MICYLRNEDQKIKMSQMVSKQLKSIIRRSIFTVIFTKTIFSRTVFWIYDIFKINFPTFLRSLNEFMKFMPKQISLLSNLKGRH